MQSLTTGWGSRMYVVRGLDGLVAVFHKCRYQLGRCKWAGETLLWVELLYWAHLSLSTSHSWKGLPHLSRSGWKLISILLRSGSIKLTFFPANCGGRRAWSLKRHQRGRVGYRHIPILLILSAASLFRRSLLRYDAGCHWLMSLHSPSAVKRSHASLALLIQNLYICFLKQQISERKEWCYRLGNISFKTLCWLPNRPCLCLDLQWVLLSSWLVEWKESRTNQWANLFFYCISRY